MTAETLIDDARDYVANIVDDATRALDHIKDNILRYAPGPNDRIKYESPELGPAPPSNLTVGPIPTFEIINLELPPDPSPAPEFQDISLIDTTGAPVFGVVAPTLTLPTKPSAVADFKGVAPNIVTTFQFPEVPEGLVSPSFEIPTVTLRDAPTKPTYTLPTFSTIEPTDPTQAPTNLQATFEGAYAGQSVSNMTLVNGYVDVMLTKYNPRYAEQMAAIETQLAKYLAGGTALNADVEDAIYSRAREKNEVEAKRVRDAAYSEAASRGFTLPSGALMSAVARARQDAANNNAKTSADIAIAQAEMEQKNLQFAVSTSASLRTTLLNAALSYMQNLISINGQALDYAKQVLASVIEVYNTQAKVYSLRLDAYKTRASVYESQLRGVMAVIDIYKGEIQALEMLTSVDKVKVDIFKAQADSLNTLANVYRSQIEVVQGKSSLEKLKLDLFKLQVESHSTLVESKNAEWRGFSAQVEGEATKVKMFSSQVESFNTQMNAYKVKIDAQSEVVRAEAATNDARSKQYSATLSAYETQVRALSASNNANIDTQRQKLIGFEASIRLAVANSNTALESYKIHVNALTENARWDYDAVLKENQRNKDYQQMLVNMSQQYSQLSGNVAQAALSGMNTLASDNKNE